VYHLLTPIAQHFRSPDGLPATVAPCIYSSAVLEVKISLDHPEMRIAIISIFCRHGCDFPASGISTVVHRKGCRIGKKKDI